MGKAEKNGFGEDVENRNGECTESKKMDSKQYKVTVHVSVFTSVRIYWLGMHHLCVLHIRLAVHHAAFLIIDYIYKHEQKPL